MYTCVYIHEVCIHIYIYREREREIVWTSLCLLTSNVRLVPSYQGHIYLAVSHNMYAYVVKISHAAATSPSRPPHTRSKKGAHPHLVGLIQQHPLLVRHLQSIPSACSPKTFPLWGCRHERSGKNITYRPVLKVQGSYCLPTCTFDYMFNQLPRTFLHDTGVVRAGLGHCLFSSLLPIGCCLLPTLSCRRPIAIAYDHCL